MTIQPAVSSLKSSQAIDPAMAALWLRTGLGMVFVIGGYFKLSQLLDPVRTQGIVDLYTSSKGYINTFFLEYLFQSPLGAVLTPWSFLTALSAFELLSGIALLAGLLVRPLALLYAFLLWTFVIALPVVTTPGVSFDGKTYLAPAILVQIRDIGLSGLMLVLYNLGAGSCSVDQRLFGEGVTEKTVDWQALGLVTRLAVAFPLLVGGFFYGMPNIQSFGSWALLLIPAGLAVAFGLSVRAAGAVVMAILAFYALQKLNFDKSLVDNLNGFKREFAFFAAGAVLVVYGGGTRYSVTDFAARLKAGLQALHGEPKAPLDAEERA